MASHAGRVRVERSEKRIRTYLGGELVADTTRPLLVWEVPHYPTYYLPEADVRTGLLSPTDRIERSPSRGEARFFDVKGGDRVAREAAWTYPESPLEELRGHVRFDWEAMDAWFEEDDEVEVHPRDPYTRVDVLRSSRHVSVEIDGTTVAESDHPVLLFETGLPTRFYLPKTDLRLDLLTPTGTTTRCPYKGTAEYYTATIAGVEHPDVAWWYRHPLPEVAPIAGRVAFFDERVDVVLDGERRPRPRTKFS